MGFFDIIKGVLLKPKEFFKDIKKEKGIKNAFLYFLIFSVITTFLSTLYFYRVFLGIKIPQIELTHGLIIWIMFVLYILILLFSLVSIFILSAIIHLFVLLMKGKKGFYQTFKTVIYAGTPNYILSILISPVYIFVFSKFSGMKQMPPEFFVWFIPLFIIGLAVLIYIIYLEVIGIKKLQEISTFRAFTAVFLLPFALLIVLYLIFLFAAIFFLGGIG